MNRIANILGCVGLMLVVCGGSQALAADRPNILWISVEDISAHLGCYGDPYANTPTLDRMAEQGVRYTRCFGHAGVCAVNRTGLINGMYPTSIGTHHMRCAGIPPAHVRPFPEYLRKAGYFTSNRSKTDYNFAPPLTTWDEQGTKHVDWRSPKRAKDQPFFCVINITTTHESKIRQDPESYQSNTTRLSGTERHDPADAIIPPIYPDTPVTRHDQAILADIITDMDKRVAEILAKLEADGLSEDTIVWFWSDHGDGLPRAKRWLYDSGLHVPMIMKFPPRWQHLASNQPGTVDDDLVAFVDYGPTVLSLAGIKPAPYMQGQPFLGRFKAQPRRYIFGARDRMDETYDLIRVVRDKRFKYIRNFEPSRPYAEHLEYMDHMPTLKEIRRLASAGELNEVQRAFMSPTKPMEELYDTLRDPWETQNLIGDPQHAGTLKRLRQQLLSWQRQTGDLGLIPESDIWEERRPSGQMAVTQKPIIELRTADGGAVELVAACKTEGAAIAYTTDAGRDAHWKIYAGPVQLQGGGKVRVRANRLGFQDSPEASVQLPGN